MDTESKPVPVPPSPEEIVLPAKKPRAKSKRFTSKEQIEKKIDKFREKAKKQRKIQEDLLYEVKQLNAMEAKEEINSLNQIDLARTARRKREEADGWGKKADRLEKEVLPRLSKKLAEFQTETIPGVLVDRSIPGI